MRATGVKVFKVERIIVTVYFAVSDGTIWVQFEYCSTLFSLK